MQGEGRVNRMQALSLHSGPPSPELPGQWGLPKRGEVVDQSTNNNNYAKRAENEEKSDAYQYDSAQLQ